MDNRPIGFFDSGLGGLTCIPHLIKTLPDERIIYFGDTARTPYGSKSSATILEFSTQIVDFLIKKDVKLIVIACNTVTATCLEVLQKKYPNTPIVGIIDSAAKKVANSFSEKDTIGIIGTKATIKNKAYNTGVAKYNSALRLFSISCPMFVPLIEEGIIDSSIMDLTIKHYLESFLAVNNVNKLVLGCTHYPLIRHNISTLYPDLDIIDPSFEIIPAIKDTLKNEQLLAQNPCLDNMFYASDLSENFINMINAIFSGTNLNITFKSLNLDSLNSMS